MYLRIIGLILAAAGLTSVVVANKRDKNKPKSGEPKTVPLPTKLNVPPKEHIPEPKQEPEPEPEPEPSPQPKKLLD